MHPLTMVNVAAHSCCVVSSPSFGQSAASSFRCAPVGSVIGVPSLRTSATSLITSTGLERFFREPNHHPGGAGPLSPRGPTVSWGT